MVPAPRRLRVEHLEEALGIDVIAPRLSWQLAEPAISRRRTGSRSARGAAAGSSRTSACSCPTKAHRSDRAPEWSGGSRCAPTPASRSGRSGRGGRPFLVVATDWTAQWIAPVEADPLPAAGVRPASVLRTRFSVRGDHQRARIYATAHGLYELFLDGERVGDQELTPGFTSYRSRVQVQTYDVGALLGAGEHELRAVLSDGWYRGKVGLHARTRRLRLAARGARAGRGRRRRRRGDRCDVDERLERDRRPRT